MPNTTCCKYVAIAVNVLVITISLLILAVLYMHSLNDEDNVIGDTTQQIVNDHREQNFFQSWLGQSLSWNDDNDDNDSDDSETNNTTISGRHLIFAAVLAYILSIADSIAIGLEHLTLLIILDIIFAFAFASSLSALIYSFLNSALENGTIYFDLWNSILITVIAISTLQAYTTSYLIFEIYIQRRTEISHQYCLAKMLPVLDDADNNCDDKRANHYSNNDYHAIKNDSSA